MHKLFYAIISIVFVIIKPSQFLSLSISCKLIESGVIYLHIYLCAYTVKANSYSGLGKYKYMALCII